MNNNERLKDAGDFPKVILLDTINYCNLRCSMCAHKVMTRPKGKMSMPLFQKLIDEIAKKDKNARVWMVFFGEALILKNKLYDEIKYAKNKGLTDVVLNSNGNLLDEKASLALIESGLDAIYIGIDAFSYETYNKLRVGGSYNKVVYNVNNLINIKRKLGVSKPEVFVQFVEMEENSKEIMLFTDYWAKQGAKVKIRPKVSWGGVVKPENVKNIDRYPCYWVMRSFNVCWDGKVVLCSVDLDAHVVVGDVNEWSIQDVWNGQLKGMRRYQLDGRYEQLPEFCRDCTDWQMARADYY